MRVAALDHVQVAMPPGGEHAARVFYGETLGLREIPKPPELAGRGGCWFELGAHQLHLGVEDDFRPARKAHIALTVEALDELRSAIEAAGGEVRDDQPIHERRRFFTDDPFGNRIELIEERT